MGAQMEGADLNEARVRTAAVTSDLSRVKGLTQEQLDGLFADGDVTDDMLPEGVTRPARWPKAALDLNTFRSEWERFKADPEGYKERAARGRSGGAATLAGP